MALASVVAFAVATATAGVATTPAIAANARNHPTSVVSAPGPVTSLAVTGKSSTTVSLSWSAPSTVGAGLSSYIVSWNSGKNSLNVPAPTTTATLTGLTPNTPYTFFVQTVDTTGAPSTSSPSVVATTLYNPPTAPQSVATSNVTSTGSTITWAAPSSVGSGITNYTVSCPTGPSCGSQTIPASATPLTASLTGLTPNTKYTATVVANSTDGQGGASGSASFTTLYTAPGPVTGLTVPSTTLATASLAWNPPANSGSGLSGFNITCSPSCGLQSAGAGASTATVNGLNPGVAYTFNVVTAATDGQTSTAATAQASTQTTPSPVTGLGVVYTQLSSGYFAAQLSWNPPAGAGNGLSSYTVSCAPSCGTQVVDSFSGTPGAVVQGLSPLTNYTFTVYATSTTGHTSTGTQVSQKTGASGFPAPGTVQNLAATYVPSNSGQAALTWNAPKPVSGGLSPTGYVVTWTCVATSPGATPSEACTSGSSQVLPANANSYTATGLQAGSVYNFTVTTQQADGQTVSTSVNGSTAFNTPSTVTLLTATPDHGNVDLIWNNAAVSTGQDTNVFYTVVTCSNATTPQTCNAIPTQQVPQNNSSSVTPGQTTTSVTGLAPNGSYTFYVYTYDSQNQKSSSASVTQSSYVAPGAVTALTATPAGSSSVSLSWTPPALTGAGIDHYAVSWSLTPGGSAVGSATYAAAPNCTPVSSVNTQVCVSIPNLTANTQYFFTVVAVANALGGSQTSPGSTTNATTWYLTPGSVTNLTVANSYLNEVDLTWSAPTIPTGADSALTYNVTCTEVAPVAGPCGAVGPTSALNASFTNLTAAGSYSFAVTATNSQGNTGSAATVAGSTTSTVGQVQNLVATASANPNQVAVTWNSPVGAGNGVQYLVTCNPSCSINTPPNSQNGSWKVVLSAGGTTGLLAANAPYVINVEALAPTVGASSITSTQVVTATDPVTNIAIAATTTTTASLTWVNPPSLANLTVSYWADSNPGSVTNVTLGGPSFPTSYKIAGLTQNTSYDVKVTTLNSAALGSDSATLTFQTGVDPVGNPTVTKTAATGFTATWVNPVTSFKSVAVGLSGAACPNGVTVVIDGNAAPCTYVAAPYNQPVWSVAKANLQATSQVVVTGLPAGGSTVFSVFTLGNTSAGSAPISQPVNLPASDLTGFSVSSSNNSPVLSWSSSVGATSYKVTCAGNTACGSPVTTSGLSYTYSGLPIGTYQFTVTPYSALQVPGASQTASGSVYSSVAQPVITGHSATASTITVNWRASAAGSNAPTISNYIVSCIDGTNCASVTVSPSAGTMSATLKSLKANSKYTVEVQAVATDGQTASSIVDVTTLKAGKKA